MMLKRSLLLCLGLFLAFTAIAVAEGTAPKEPLVGKFPLKSASVERLMHTFTTPYAAGGLQEFLPVKSENIICLVGMNTFLVRADTQQALTDFGKLLAIVDTPERAIIAQITVIYADAESARALTAQFKISVPSSEAEAPRNSLDPKSPTPATPAPSHAATPSQVPVMQTNAWKQVIAQLTDEKKATVIGTPRKQLLTAGKPAVIDTRESRTPFEALLLTDIYTQGNIVMGKVEAILPSPLLTSTQNTATFAADLAIKEGETALLYSGIDPVSSKRDMVLIFITPTILKEK